MRLPLLVTMLPVQLFILGLILTPTLVSHHTHAAAVRAGAVAQQSLEYRTTASVQPYYEGVPVRIVLPSIGIDLPIVSQYYDAAANQWPVADDSANFASDGVLANTLSGKAFIYGHWTQKVFGATTHLQAGSLVYIYTDNGHLFEYSYTGYRVVSPSDVTVIQDVDSVPGINVMTCQGTFAQERRIMSFDLRRSL